MGGVTVQSEVVLSNPKGLCPTHTGVTSLKYGSGSQGGYLTRNRGSLARKLLLTGFLAVYVRASQGTVNQGGHVQWVTCSAKTIMSLSKTIKWEDRWVFLHRDAEQTTLFRFETPEVPENPDSDY